MPPAYARPDAADDCEPSSPQTTAGASPHPPHPARASGLDGLRALAVAAVILYHVDPSWLPGGFLGVDVFFVLSGYLITSLLLAQRRKRIRGLSSFWARRARRLLPELLGVLVATACATALIGHDANAGLRGAAVASLSFVGNWWLIRQQSGYFAAHGSAPVLQHLWSLGVEEQFYLLWPLLLVAVLRFVPGRARPAVPLALAVASFAGMAAFFHAGSDPSRLYYGSDTHSGGLLIGASAALLMPMYRLRTLSHPRAVKAIAVGGPCGFVFVACAALLMDGTASLTYRGGIAAVSVACVPLCLAAASQGTLARILSIAPLPWIGRRSYGIYLWHWPVIACMSYLTPGSTSLPWWLAAVELTAPVALAAASYRWLQQPILTHGWRTAWSTLLASYDAYHVRRPNAARTLALLTVTPVSTAFVSILLAPATTALQSQIQAGQATSAAAAADQHTGAPVGSPGGRHPDTCGATSKQPSSPAAPPLNGNVIGVDITAVGDSVMLASATALERALPGIGIDARVGRQMAAAPALLRNQKVDGELRRIVVVGLGSNGDFPDSVLTSVLSIAGPRSTVVLITVHVRAPWQDPVNARLSRFVARHPGTLLIRWDQAADAHPDELWPDGTHPRPDGAELYAATFKSALEQGAAAAPAAPCRPGGQAAARAHAPAARP